MKKAIIIGATSGIGYALGKLLLEKGFHVGMCGRRTGLLNDLKKEYGGRLHVQKLDLSDTAKSIKGVAGLIKKMDGMDLLVVSSGVGFLNHEMDLKKEMDTISINVAGFTAMANAAVKYFEKKCSGHIAAISSIAAVRGGSESPAYNASKAYMSSYMEGLRQRMSRRGAEIYVTDIQPGFVNTAMAKGDGLFWVAPPEKAARQIFRAIQKRKTHVYITRRWRLIAWLLKIAPAFIYDRF